METTTTNITTTEQSSAVKIEEFKALISNAPAALAENQNSCAKAIEAGNKLIELAKQGMNDILDVQLSAYINKIKTTKKAMNEKRSPFTQMMTVIAKEFTTLESSLDGPVDTLQGYRNQHATDTMKKRQEAERLAQLKLAKEQEAIEIEKLYRIAYSTASADYILKFKTEKTEWFNALTLANIDQASAIISQFDNNLSDSDFVFQVAISLIPQYHSIEEKVMITGNIARSLCYGALADFKTSIADFKRELEDILPSKRNQLEETERLRLEDLEKQRVEAERQRLADEAAAEAARKAAAEADVAKKLKLQEDARQAALKAEVERQQNEAAEIERKRIAAEQAETERQRQEAERKRQEAEAAIAAQQAEAAATVNATGQSVSAMVDTQANLFTEAPKVKEGYNIKVLNPAGNLQLVSFWFENEGKKLPQDKIESMTFGRVKTFCEKYAVKNDVTIESKLLMYEPVYKAK